MSIFGYAVSLDLGQKPCLVVGGGVVAERKIHHLLTAGAVVTVIAPALEAEGLLELARVNKICWRAKTFVENDLQEQFFLVIASTNDPHVNQQVAAICQEKNILVNVVDDKDASNFIVNASLQRGELLLAVSTNGASPIFAQKIKDELAEHYDESYGDALAIYKEARAYILATAKNSQDKKEKMTRLRLYDVVDDLKNFSKNDVIKRVMACLLS